jgi:hypothetical protein
MRQDRAHRNPQYRGKPGFCVALAVLALAALNIAAVQARTPIVDGDADGVDDAVDQCLYTSPRAAVDARGCSAQTDQDGDGVADAVDDCPYTTPGAEVDARGCALDDDFDGVANGLDACVDTELGALVDTQGCSKGQVAKAITPKPRSLPPASALSSVPTPPVVTPAAATTVIEPAAPLPKPEVAPPPVVIASAPVITTTPPPVPAPVIATQPRAPVRIVIPAPPTATAPVTGATRVAAKPAIAAAPNPAALLSLSFGSKNNNIANALRRALEKAGLDGKRLRSVGHHAVDAGGEFRRADVVLETE